MRSIGGSLLLAGTRIHAVLGRDICGRLETTSHAYRTDDGGDVSIISECDEDARKAATKVKG